MSLGYVDPPVAPLRALIVEDEWPARNYLVELLQGTRLAEVIGAVPDVEGAIQALRPEPEGLTVDVVFVDVQLAGSQVEDAGMHLVRTYAGRPGAPAFVLATAFRDHALEAFEFGVVDYLLKPFTEERIEACVRRLSARRSTAPRSGAQPSKIVARRKKGLVFLKPDEVWAYEAADRLTFVHTRLGRFDLDLSLSAIEASFGHTLLRAHRNWLVNPAHVKELIRDGGDSELFVGAELDEAAGIRVPVARDRAPLVRDALLADAAGVRRP